MKLSSYLIKNELAMHNDVNLKIFTKLNSELGGSANKLIRSVKKHEDFFKSVVTGVVNDKKMSISTEADKGRRDRGNNQDSGNDSSPPKPEQTSPKMPDIKITLDGGGSSAILSILTLIPAYHSMLLMSKKDQTETIIGKTVEDSVIEVRGFYSSLKATTIRLWEGLKNLVSSGYEKIIKIIKILTAQGSGDKTDDFKIYFGFMLIGTLLMEVAYRSYLKEEDELSRSEDNMSVVLEGIGTKLKDMLKWIGEKIKIIFGAIMNRIDASFSDPLGLFGLAVFVIGFFGMVGSIRR